MSSFQWKRRLIGALIINAVIGPNWSFAQSPTPTNPVGVTPADAAATSAHFG